MENRSLLARFPCKYAGDIVYCRTAGTRNSVSWEYRRSGAVSARGARVVPRTTERNATTSYKCEIIRVNPYRRYRFRRAGLCCRTETLRPVPAVSLASRPGSNIRNRIENK